MLDVDDRVVAAGKFSFMPHKDKASANEWQRKHGRRYYITRRARNRAIVEKAKNVPCADCGHQYPPYVMDFDHVRGSKVADIAMLIGQGSEDKLLEEISKCEVVCANCHRIRTWSGKYKSFEELTSTFRDTFKEK